MTKPSGPPPLSPTPATNGRGAQSVDGPGEGQA
jgi:hypothetical protein